MGFSDLFKAGEYKERCELLSKRVDELEALLTPSMRDEVATKRRLAELREAESKTAERIDALNDRLKTLEILEAKYDETLADKKSQIESFDDEILVQQFGLYEPRFDFATSTQFKDELKRCRDRQKEMIKKYNADAAYSDWTVNGSKAQGKKMVKDVSKLLMRAYNSECDDVVRKVKASNVDKSIERVNKLADQINRLGKVLHVELPRSYPSLKEREVRLAYEFALQKEKEREVLRELREQEREERRLAREIAEARKKLEKEKKQYLGAYKEIAHRLANADENERADLEEKAAELRAKLDDVEIAVKDVDYREANRKAGFVYVISNIGSFGEGVYKIGMTRRLDPMERVRELGDASVPFNFDVHALIFCDDAPKLEAALHNRFEDRKVNIVNQRREFFRVSLEEIEQVVKENYDKTVEFKEVPDADQFRTSEVLRQKGIFTAPKKG